LARGLTQPTASLARVAPCAAKSIGRSLARPSPLRPVACWHQHRSLLAVGLNPTVQRAYRPVKDPVGPILTVSPRPRLSLSRCSLAAERPRRRGRRAAVALPATVAPHGSRMERILPPLFLCPSPTTRCGGDRAPRLAPRRRRRAPPWQRPSPPFPFTGRRTTAVEDGVHFAPEGLRPFDRGGGKPLHCLGPSSQMPLKRCASRSIGTARPCGGALCRRSGEYSFHFCSMFLIRNHLGVFFWDFD
jgi:hypothetical protein